MPGRCGYEAPGRGGSRACLRAHRLRRQRPRATRRAAVRAGTRPGYGGRGGIGRAPAGRHHRDAAGLRRRLACRRCGAGARPDVAAAPTRVGCGRTMRGARRRRQRRCRRRRTLFFDAQPHACGTTRPAGLGAAGATARPAPVRRRRCGAASQVRHVGAGASASAVASASGTGRCSDGSTRRAALPARRRGAGSSAAGAAGVPTRPASLRRRRQPARRARLVFSARSRCPAPGRGGRLDASSRGAAAAARARRAWAARRLLRRQRLLAPLATGVSAKMSPVGSVMLRCRARRSTNWRATTSSIVLDALLTSMP